MKYLYFFLFSVFFLPSFSQGFSSHYWDHDGVKHKGAIALKFTAMPPKETCIYFTLDGKEKELICKENMQSFVAHKDSFAFIDGYKSYKADFAKVIRVGKINAYIQTRSVATYPVILHPNSFPIPFLRNYEEIIVVNKKGSNDFYRIAYKNQFKYLFMPLVQDNETLIKEINGTKKKEWIEDLLYFIDEYNKTH